jgi:pilus assembly protein CpaE
MNQLNVGLIIANQDLWNEVQACLRELPVRVPLQQQVVGDWTVFLEQLERLRLDVVLVDITRSQRTFEELMRRLKSISVAPQVVVLNSSADPETILTVIRAGANEYLYPPLEAGLRKAVERMSGERAKRHVRNRPRARTLGFLSAKGGCGATTIACHVAVELQRMTSQEILLADFDLDTGIVGFLMKAKTPYTLLDAVQNIHRLDLSYWKALISNGQAKLEVIPAPPVASIKRSLDPEPFRQVLNFAQSAYDWIVADLGRNLNVLSMNLLEDVDDVFLVATLDLPALHQAKQVAQTLMDYGYSQNRLHLILNRMPKRADFTPEEVQRILGLPVYATLPNDYPELFEAYAHGTLLASNSDLGQHFAKLAMKIAGVQKQKGKSKVALSI